MTYEATIADAPDAPYHSPRRRVRAGGLILSVIVLVVGAWWLANLLLPSHTSTSATNFDPTERLVLNTDGDVTVRAGDVDRIEVTRTVHRGLFGPSYDENVSGNALEISAGCGWLALGACGIDYEIVLPAQMATELHASSGDITVDGLDGSVTVYVSSGDAVIRNVTGEIRADSSSGDIQLQDVVGNMQLTASSGDISGDGLTASVFTGDVSSGDLSVAFTEAPDAINFEASSGDISITVPDDGAPYRVSGTTASGDRHVEVATDPGVDRSARLETASGDVTFAYARS